MGLDADEAVLADGLLDPCLERLEELGVGAARFQELLEERVHLEEADLLARGQVEDRVVDRQVGVHDGADDPAVRIEHLRVAGEPCLCRPAVPLGGDRLQRGFAAEEFRELADHRQDGAHVGKVEQEVIGCAPELGFGDAVDGGVGDAVEELPGEPDRFDGLLFGFEDMAMVVYNGTLGEIWHDGVPPFGI